MKYLHFFTLIEVLISLTILSIGIFCCTFLLSNAKERSSKAFEEWNATHEIVQSAEYLLLAGVDDPIPERFVSKEYQISFTQSPVNNLPPGVYNQKDTWELVTLNIKLFDSTGKLLKLLDIDRIIQKKVL